MGIPTPELVKVEIKSNPPTLLIDGKSIPATRVSLDVGVDFVPVAKVEFVTALDVTTYGEAQYLAAGFGAHAIGPTPWAALRLLADKIEAETPTQS